jgi:hydrogenase maturation protein HypF
MTRLALLVSGVVQGVGFRPFVYRAAVARGLDGWVQNGTSGVRIEVQGPEPNLESFVCALRSELPAPGHVADIRRELLPDVAEAGFEIRESSTGSGARPTLPADLATCEQCVREIRSPEERRYRYPFTNCTRCGPRYSIVEGLPYDRPRTSMKEFALCEDCAKEYEDPLDRRFDAQPMACPRCGPRLELIVEGKPVARGELALTQAVEALGAGRIVALRGLGGFQFLVDAENEAAVRRLRLRKQRDDKPFAVMFPTLEAARDAVELDDEEERALRSSEAPIVLVRRRAAASIAEAVAPNNPLLGAMVPYTPLHHLLLSAVGRPLVCTSGNLSEEPMCTEVGEALDKLGAIADGFLVHDRPIVRPVDDSVARVHRGRLRVLRRARGYAPLPVARLRSERTVLGVGAHLKSSVALGVGGQVVLSQHLGDLEGVDNVALLERTVADLVRFFDARVELIACDLHPDYASTRLAERLSAASGVPLVRVQHHHAHVAACMAEHALEGPSFGLAWDGMGFGADGTIWGGEALVCRGATFERVAHLHPFPLPGGDRAAREPRRAALGLLYELGGAEAAAEHGRRWFEPRELDTLLRALRAGVNAQKTSSMGRLFDAVAALLDLRQTASFEGQAAMELEFCAQRADDSSRYPFSLSGDSPVTVDIAPLVAAVLDDRKGGTPPPIIARRFHNTLIELGVTLASRAGMPDVALTGGCFQNALLAGGLAERLEARGFRVHEPTSVPPNDGSISLGQVHVAANLGGHTK